LLPLSYFVFGAIVVWFGVRLSISGENECGAINFICTLFYFVGASFRNSRIICTNSKAIGATERVLNGGNSEKSTQRKILLRLKK
jgi:hypothetical protein